MENLKTILSTLSFLILSITLSAQSEFSVEPTEHKDTLLNVDLNVFHDFRYESTMTNETTEDLILKWRILDLEYPEPWFLVISDLSLEVIISGGFLEDLEGVAPVESVLVPDPVFSDIVLHITPEEMPGCLFMELEIFNVETEESYDTIRYEVIINECDGFSSNSDINVGEWKFLQSNIVGDQLSLMGDLSQVSLDILNTNGQIVQSHQNLVNGYINISGLESGGYFIRYKDPKLGKPITERFVKIAK